MINEYYVYEHSYMENDKKVVFYVGKGNGDRAYRKHGKGRDNGVWNKIAERLNYNYNIDIVKENLSNREALDYELQLQKHYWQSTQCVANINYSPAHRKKQSEAKKGKNHWTKEKLTKRYAKMVEKGKWRTPEKIESDRQKMLERKTSCRFGENNGMYGKIGKLNPNSKLIYVFKNDEFIGKYHGSAECSEALNIPASTAKAYARGISNHYHKKSGYSFYREDKLNSVEK